jgi:hypothetical protein
MDDTTLPWHFANARDLPPGDDSEVKQSMIALVQQLQKRLPPMLIQELPLWLNRFQKIERNRWKYLIVSHEQAQTLANWHKLRLDQPEIAAKPVSRHALEFGLRLRIQPDDWPNITAADLQERLHAHLRDIRAELMIAVFDVIYLRTIALVMVTGAFPETDRVLNTMIDRLREFLRDE